MISCTNAILATDATGPLNTTGPSKPNALTDTRRAACLSARRWPSIDCSNACRWCCSASSTNQMA
ncbi:MAG TPA: hypothetical protein PKY50_04540 [Candidatus Competibacter sp.]|nr:hypothetical protein [Candidatus Competibacter sp.]